MSGTPTKYGRCSYTGKAIQKNGKCDNTTDVPCSIQIGSLLGEFDRGVKLRDNAFKSLQCMYIEVDSGIATSVFNSVKDYIDYLEEKLKVYE